MPEKTKDNSLKKPNQKKTKNLKLTVQKTKKRIIWGRIILRFRKLKEIKIKPNINISNEDN